jgi:hypothetical protein
MSMVELTSNCESTWAGVRILAVSKLKWTYKAQSVPEELRLEGIREIERIDQSRVRKLYRKITALRDDARRNREKWRFV